MALADVVEYCPLRMAAGSITGPLHPHVEVQVALSGPGNATTI